MRVHKLFASTALRPMRSTWSFCGQRLGAIVFAAPLSSAVAAHSSSGLGTLGTKLSDPSLLRTEAFVAGEWTQGEAFQVTDPATGNVIAEVSCHILESGRSRHRSARERPSTQQRAREKHEYSPFLDQIFFYKFGVTARL